MATLFLSVSSILAVFDIVKAKDENGKEIEVSAELDVNTVWYVQSLFYLEAGVLNVTIWYIVTPSPTSAKPALGMTRRSRWSGIW